MVIKPHGFAIWEKVQRALDDMFKATGAEEWMAMSVIRGLNTDTEKFAGAFESYCIEAMMQDGKLDYVWLTSRGSAHLHHMVYRSHCGDNSTRNLIALCAGHHQRGLHAGRIRVSGNADDELIWQLGLKNGVPLETHRTRMASACR